MDIKIPITKLFLVLPILAFLAESEKDYPDHSAFFARQKWTVRDAYVAVFCATGLVFTCSVLWPLWFGPRTSHFDIVPFVLAWLGFPLSTYWAMRERVDITWLTFGIDKTHFLTSGVLALNIALGYFSLSAAGVGIPLLDAFGAESLLLSSWVQAAVFGSSLLFWVDAAIFGFGLPFCEELLFRGVLYAPVARRAGKWIAVVMLAVVECLLYVNLGLAQSAVMFVVFVGFYLIYMRTESLLAPLILHIGINIAILQPMSMAAMARYTPAETVRLLFICVPLFVLLIVDAWALLNFLSLRRSNPAPRN